MTIGRSYLNSSRNDIKQLTHPIKKERRLIMLKALITVGIFLTVNSAPIYMPTTVPTTQETPAYAKWGTLAINETKSKYPNASIIDYLHQGRETNERSTIEKFKLWLKDGDHEFGVFVTIEYTTDTEEVVNIKLQETSQ